MLDSNITEGSTGDFNIELIKADVQTLTRDITSFLPYLLQQDVKTLKRELMNNSANESVQMLKMFFHILLVHKVPYMNQAFIKPQIVFPQPGEGQRSGILLNLSTLLLLVCTSRDNDVRTLKKFEILSKDLKDFILPNSHYANPPWFDATHVELLTQILIMRLVALKSNSMNIDKSFNLKILINSNLENLFRAYLQLPLFHERAYEIGFVVMSRINQKHSGLDEIINLLSLRYPYSKFVEIIWNFIKKSYDYINAIPFSTLHTSASNIPEITGFSNPTKNKRRKTLHPGYSDSDTDDVIKILVSPNSVSNFELGNESLTSKNSLGLQENRNVISSDTNLIQPGLTVPKLYSFYRKPNKFLAHFQVTMVGSKRFSSEIERMDNDQIELILNSSGVEDSRLHVTDSGDLEWNFKKQKPSQLTAQTQDHFSDFKRPVIWKKRKRHSETSSGSQLQMIPELSNLLIDKFSVKSTGRSVSPVPLLALAKNSNSNRGDFGNLSPETNKRDPTTTSSTISNNHPNPVVAISQNQPQPPATLNPTSQQWETGLNFSFYLIGDFFNSKKSSETKSMHLLEFVAYFSKVINQPASLTQLVGDVRFVISVPHSLVSSVTNQKDVYENELLTTLEKDFSQFLRKYFISLSIPSDSQHQLLLEFNRQKKKIPLSIIRKHIISVISLLTALLKVGLSVYYKDSLLNYKVLAESLYNRYVEEHKTEFSFIEEKAFAVFCKKIILETHSNMQQSVLPQPMPVAKSSNVIQNLSVQNNSGYKTNRLSDLNGQSFDSSSQGLHYVQKQQNPELYGSNMNLPAQLPISPTFTTVNFKITSTATEIMDKDLIINVISSTVKRLQELPHKSSQKEIITLLMEEICFRYQQCAKGKIKYSLCDPQRLPKSFMHLNVKFDRFNLLVVIHHNFMVSGHAPNILQSVPASMKQIRSDFSENHQNQYKSAISQKDSSSVTSNSSKPVPQQAEHRLIELREVKNTPTFKKDNHVLFNEAIKHMEQSSEQSTQVYDEPKTHLNPPSSSSSNKLTPVSTSTGTSVTAPSFDKTPAIVETILDNSFGIPMTQKLKDIRKRLEDYFPFRVLFSKFTSIHGTNQAEFDKVMISFYSLSILISESVINFLSKLDLNLKEFKMLQKQAIKTTNEVFSTLTMQQLALYIQGDTTSGVLVKQLKSIPKKSMVYRTLMGIPNKSGKYSKQEILLLSYVWLTTATQGKNLAKAQYEKLKKQQPSLFPPKNSAEPLSNTNDLSKQTLVKTPVVDNNSELLSLPSSNALVTNRPTPMLSKSLDSGKPEVVDASTTVALKKAAEIGTTKITEEVSSVVVETPEQQGLSEKSEKSDTFIPASKSQYAAASVQITAAPENPTEMAEKSAPAATDDLQNLPILGVTVSGSTDLSLPTTIGEKLTSRVEPSSPQEIPASDSPTSHAKPSTPQAILVDIDPTTNSKASSPQAVPVSDSPTSHAKPSTPQTIPFDNDPTTNSKASSPQAVSISSSPTSNAEPSYPKATSPSEASTSVKEKEVRPESFVYQSMSSPHTLFSEAPKPASKIKPHFIDTLISLDIPDIDKNRFEDRISLFNSEGDESESEFEENSLVPKIKMFKKLAAHSREPQKLI